LHPEATPQGVGAGPVLTEGGVAPTLERIETNEAPVGGLVHWVQNKESERDLHRQPHPASDRLVAEQPLERKNREPTEPFALASEPFLEGRLIEAQPFEQVASVERHRITEGVRASVQDQCLELKDIDRLGDERDRLAVRRERFRFGGRKGVSEMPQRLPEALARLLLLHPAPAKCGEPVASCAPLADHGQIGQQRTALPYGKRQGEVISDSGLEIPQDTNPQPSHRAPRLTYRIAAGTIARPPIVFSRSFPGCGNAVFP